MSLDRGSLPEAEAQLKEYRSARGITPEYLEAYSWLGRYALAQKKYQQATMLAEQTYAMVEAELKKRPLDAETTASDGVGSGHRGQSPGDGRRGRAA